MTVEKYQPVIRKEKVLDIKGTDYESKLDSIMDDSGFIKTRLNEEVIIQAVSHKLYKDPESGLRELYNNEAYHGCLVAKKDHNVTNPYIKVSLNTTTRKLIIQGFNSLGITEEVFTEILIELGTSGNKDRTKTGKFGMGFASYTKLSDIMILETQCINGDTYAVLAKGGLGFQKLPKPKLESTGTRLTLTLRADINYNKLVNMLTDLALTSGIKTYFELESSKKINGFESGLHTLEQLSYKQIFDNLNNGSDEDYSYLKSSFINDEVEVHLAVAVNKNGAFQNNRNKKFYLCNSPIQVTLDEEDSYKFTDGIDEYEDPDEYKKAELEQKKYKSTRIDDIEFETLIVNMKDEDLYEPMQDRERTTKEAETRLRKIIIDLYNETLKKIKPCEDLNSWFNHEHKYFISSTEADIVKILDDKSKAVQKLLNTNVFEYEIDQRLKYETKSLDSFITKSKNYFYVLKKDKRVQDLIFENFPDSFMVMVNPEKEPFHEKSTFNDTVKTLKYFGFKEARQYCKDNNIKQKRFFDGEKEIKTSEDIVLHYTGSSSGYSSYGSNSLNELTRTEKINSPDFNGMINDVIKVTPFAKYRDVLKQLKTEFYLCSDKKGLEGVQSIDDIEKHFRDTFFKVESNQGLVTFEELLKHKNIIVNYEAFDNSDEDSLRGLAEIPKTTLYISTNKDIIFKLALVFVKNGIDYKIENENLDHYYKPKVVKLAKTLNLINEDLESRNSFSVYEFERYLFTVRDVEIKVQDEKLRKLFKLSHTQDNFEEIKKDVLELNEKLRTENTIIQRKSKEYFS